MLCNHHFIVLLMAVCHSRAGIIKDYLSTRDSQETTHVQCCSFSVYLTNIFIKTKVLVAVELLYFEQSSYSKCCNTNEK